MLIIYPGVQGGTTGAVLQNIAFTTGVVLQNVSFTLVAQGGFMYARLDAKSAVQFVQIKWINLFTSE